MDNSRVDESLEEAEEVFESTSDTTEIEEGLGVGNDKIHLRKACRMIESMEALEVQDGFHTAKVELAFNAIERTLHFYLVDVGHSNPEESGSHGQMYGYGADVGLYSEDMAVRFGELRGENRSDSYYRTLKATEEHAEKMEILAKAFHRHVISMRNQEEECVCTVCRN